VDATVAQADDSGVSATQIANSDIRASKVGFIEPSDSSAWLYKLITAGIAHHNQTYYGYDLTGIETLQFSEYRAPAGHYGAHLDWGSSRNGVQTQARKLSFTVQLSDPDSYEGGDLVIHDGQEQDPEIVAKRRALGSIIVFPSWVLHEVTPVTKGTRRSLVGWCVGPEFR
jgi:PKHD-type hydroxylase